ncbi:MAG: PIN domain-containing protein [Armatimonadota bacterium]|nr:PIN domain-containing protein [Armatimonadota bacterium]
MRSPIRVYVDTSVFGGVFDEEFRDISARFFEAVRTGRFVLVSSGLVEDELAPSPARVQDFFEEISATGEVVDLSDEALALRDSYVSSGVVSAQYVADALHVALATTTNCNMIVSWNFKHIVNYRRVQQYNAVNILNGYGSILICSPPEVVENED